MKSVLEQSQIFGAKVIESIEKYMTISNVTFMKTLELLIRNEKDQTASSVCKKRTNDIFFNKLESKLHKPTFRNSSKIEETKENVIGKIKLDNK